MITLIQPRHIYAPEPSNEKLGHIYMPTSLLAAAAILLNAGLEISILDENIETHSFDNNALGINLLGAPYIPTAIQYAKSLKRKYDRDFVLILGGQTVSGLSDNQLSQLFGPNVLNGNKTDVLSKAFSIAKQNFQEIEGLSLIPAYSQLSDEYMRLYLKHEFGFYLSQGCKYACSFCAATRSSYDPITKKLTRIKELYRNLDIAYRDLEYLILKAQSFGISGVQLYLSNLDLFQNPSTLNQFAEKVIQLKGNYHNFSINQRALSTVRSFLHTHKSNPNVIVRMIEAGLHRVGFGIDGATPKIWKETRKPQTKSECIQAIAIAKEVYGLTPETLMVFGYNELENKTSLQLAYEFARDMYEKYGALPRPHVAKDIVPGNDGWNDKQNEHRVNQFIHSSMLFQNLDFTALPSPYTHPNNQFRELVTKYYLKICHLPPSLTQYVKPESPSLSKNELNEIRMFNMKRYDI